MGIIRAGRVARMLMVTRDEALGIRDTLLIEDGSPSPFQQTCLDVAACGSSHDRAQRASAKGLKAQKWNQFTAHSWLRADDCEPCI